MEKSREEMGKRCKEREGGMIRGVREEGRREVGDFIIAIFCHLNQYSYMTN